MIDVFKHLIIGVFCFLPLLLGGQPDVSGAWTGVITQQEGGVLPEYEFELYFNQQGKKITGRSYVFFDDKYAVMEIVGNITTDGQIHFNETKIVEFRRLADYLWCIKTGDLQLDKRGGEWRLTGDWRGYTESGSPCVPGRIILTKEVPRV